MHKKHIFFWCAALAIFCSNTLHATLTVTRLLTLTGHTGSIYAISWHPTKPELLASASSDGTIKIWDTRYPDKTPITLTGHKYLVTAISWHPTKPDLIASSSYDKTIKIWDSRYPQKNPITLATEFSEWYFSDCAGWVTSVAWHPTDPTRLASATYDNIVKIWDAEFPDKKPTKLSTHYDRLNTGGNTVTWHPTNLSFLALTSSSAEAKKSWDTKDPYEIIKDWNTNTPCQIRLIYWTNALAFNKQGNKLATASYDKKIIIWQLSGPEISQDSDPD